MTDKRQSHPSYFVSRWKIALELQDERIRDSSDQVHSQVDLDLYVLILRNLVRAIEYARDQTSSNVIKEALAEFKQSVPGWLNVRDFVEHFDEYSVGIGRLQKKQIATVYGPYYAKEEKFDTDGILISKNFYLSFGEGNQIDISTATREALKMAAIALKTCSSRRAH